MSPPVTTLGFTTRKAEAISPASHYEADEHAWLLEQIAILQSGSLGSLDASHLAEYLTDMAKRDRREIKSRFQVLLAHLLKVNFQRQKLSRSWLATILEQQAELTTILDDSAALRRLVPELYDAAYPVAVRLAAAETGLGLSAFPAVNPWTAEQALIPDTPEVDPAALLSGDPPGS